MAERASFKGSLLLFGIVDRPPPRTDIDVGKNAGLCEGIAGGDLAGGVERGRRDHPQASVHGLAVWLGEGPGENEGLAEALEIGKMLGTVGLAQRKTAR